MRVFVHNHTERWLVSGGRVPKACIPKSGADITSCDAHIYIYIYIHFFFFPYCFCRLPHWPTSSTTSS